MDYIKIEQQNNVRLITLNKPNKKNAINVPGYQFLTETLNKDALDDSIITTIITGTGQYFSSGNDLSGRSAADDNEDIEAVMDSFNLAFKNFVTALIEYPKLLIAVVNGPAIGIAVTMLPLCDVVFASDRATFQTPFVKLGLVAEACSSFTFERVLGKSKAAEMLLLGHVMTAKEAYEFKLVSHIIPHEFLQEKIRNLMALKLPVNSLKRNKMLMKRNAKKLLSECNDVECAELRKATNEEDFLMAVMEFMQRKSKL